MKSKKKLVNSTKAEFTRKLSIGLFNKINCQPTPSALKKKHAFIHVLYLFFNLYKT